MEFKGAGVTCAGDARSCCRSGQSGACTFTVAGTIAYSDPNTKGNTYRGSVTVTAPPGQAAADHPGCVEALVVYGTKVSLTGKVEPRQGRR